MGGGGGVSILSHRPVTSSDLKQDRLFFRESVSTFLLLVEAARLYLLNNKVLSYLISANTVSVLRTKCPIKSRTLFHVEL